MGGTTLKTLSICAALVVGGAYFHYGTLSPCDALRETTRRQEDLARVLPDLAIDLALTAQYGQLSPGRCVAALVSGKVMRAPTVASQRPGPVQLASPASPPGATQTASSTLQTGGYEAVVAMNECRAKRLSGELKSFVASAQCSGPRIIEAFSKANYRYMDLVKLMVAKRAQISERLDRGEMSEADANVAFQRAFADVATAEKMRDTVPK
jgi:hypothetical protein